jgi:UTP--glucose-1-phosphate uridylyltransferase
LLEKTAPGAGGEIQLTDALHQLNEIENMSAYHIVGKTHDCGNKLGFIKANLEYSLQRPEFRDDLTKAIKDLITDPTL